MARPRGPPVRLSSSLAPKGRGRALWDASSHPAGHRAHLLDTHHVRVSCRGRAPGAAAHTPHSGEICAGPGSSPLPNQPAQGQPLTEGASPLDTQGEELVQGHQHTRVGGRSRAQAGRTSKPGTSPLPRPSVPRGSGCCQRDPLPRALRHILPLCPPTSACHFSARSPRPAAARMWGQRAAARELRVGCCRALLSARAQGTPRPPRPGTTTSPGTSFPAGQSCGSVPRHSVRVGQSLRGSPGTCRRVGAGQGPVPSH